MIIWKAIKIAKRNTNPCQWFSSFLFDEAIIDRIHLSNNNTFIKLSDEISTINIKSKKKAAILIPLCNRFGEASILFTLRTNTVSTHKGQVSFPGGHINLEENESDSNCALRETYEEIGSNIGPIKLLAVCQTIPAITGTSVTPILGFLSNDVKNFEHFDINKIEVERVFTRSIKQLLSPSFRTEETYIRNEKSVIMPVFSRNNNYKEEGYELLKDDEKIWGLTAFVLDSILKKVIIPVYNNYD